LTSIYLGSLRWSGATASCATLIELLFHQKLLNVNKELLSLGLEIGLLLKARGETVAVAESSTGGLISAALLSVPGASAYYLGGAVVYTRRARKLLMDLPNDAVAGLKSASEPYAVLLAQQSQQRFAATWGISETGASGPTGNPYGDAAGHSCLAIAGPVAKVMTLETGLTDRWQNMLLFSCTSLRLFAQALR
jgi:nicotinamide-nucleotide amidase